MTSHFPGSHLTGSDPHPSDSHSADSRGLVGYESIEDLTITLRAELDHKTVSFQDLLNLNVGSVLHLGRPTGENIDLYAEDVLLGSGEILVVDSTLAVRIADFRDRPAETKQPNAS